MTASFINNNHTSVIKSPFPNSLGGITSKYESRGGTKRKTKKTKRTKRTKTRKTRKGRVRN